MEEKLVTFDTAKLAKEKGFTIRDIKLMGYTSKFYNHNTKTLLAYGRTGRTDLTKAYFAPTQSLLQRWLRDIHDIYIIVLPFNDETRFYFNVTVIEIKEYPIEIDFECYSDNMHNPEVKTYE